MHLTHFTDYSMRVLIYLALHSEKLATIDEISHRFKISRNHLMKVVTNLSQQGLIKSFRGKNGGIQLARDPKTYRFGDLVRDLEPDMNIVECFGGPSNACPIAGCCELEVILYEARQSFLDTLNRYTLADCLRTKGVPRLEKALGLLPET